MAGRALQIVGNGPVVLISVGLVDHVGDHRRGAAQLGMAEGVPTTLFGEEFAVGPVAALGYHNGAEPVCIDPRFDHREESFLIERNFWEEHHDWDVAVFDQTACSGDPTGVPAHDFDHEDLG